MLACGNIAAAQQVSDAYSTMSPEGLRTGVIVREADCARDPIAVWVTAPHADGTVEGACIRYYAAGLAASNPVAFVFLHGNRLDRSFDKEGRLIRVAASASAYGNPSAAGLAASAAQQATALGHPFIILARPGYYGSSGIANEQYRRREVLLVNAALYAIKQRHGIARFGVSSQSGGGPSLAGILSLRSDVDCAAFSSSLTAFDEREQALKDAMHSPPLHQVTPDAYDPIRETASIRPRPEQRIFVVGDPNDKLIPLAAQQAYFEALKRQGVRTAMTTSTAVGDSHHSLGATGQHAVGWCIDGLPDDEILARMGKGEAAYKLAQTSLTLGGYGTMDGSWQRTKAVVMGGRVTPSQAVVPQRALYNRRRPLLPAVEQGGASRQRREPRVGTICWRCYGQNTQSPVILAHADHLQVGGLPEFVPRAAVD